VIIKILLIALAVALLRRFEAGIHPLKLFQESLLGAGTGKLIKCECHNLSFKIFFYKNRVIILIFKLFIKIFLS
jgi:hypothetical protein